MISRVKTIAGLACAAVLPVLVVPVFYATLRESGSNPNRRVRCRPSPRAGTAYFSWKSKLLRASRTVPSVVETIHPICLSALHSETGHTLFAG